MEAQIMDLLDHMSDALYVVDENWRITYVNRTVEELWGQRSDELLGKNIWEVFPQAVDSHTYHALLSAMQEQQSVAFEYFSPTLNRWFDMSVYPTGKGLVVHFNDITTRKQAEEERSKQQEILQTIFDHIPVTIRFFSPDGHFQLVNRAWEHMLGWSLEEIQQSNLDLFEQLYPEPQERQRARQFVAEATGEWADFRIRVRDGRVVDVAFANMRLSDGTNIGIGQDITARKRAEDALRRAHDDLEVKVAERTRELVEANAALRVENAERERVEQAHQQLLKQLINAQEEERRRLSRELHDSLGQDLTVLLLGLKALRDAAPADAPIHTHIAPLQALATRMGRDVRTLALELRPSALDDLGLVATLANYAEQWSARTLIGIDFQPIGMAEQRLPAAIETALYRLAQEALTNVLKHAQATNVSLILERRLNAVHMIIEDNGAGFDVELARRTAHTERRLGLIGMEERAMQFGGTLALESAPGHGATVFIHIPLPPEANKSDATPEAYDL